MTVYILSRPDGLLKVGGSRGDHSCWNRVWAGRRFHGMASVEAVAPGRADVEADLLARMRQVAPTAFGREWFWWTAGADPIIDDVRRAAMAEWGSLALTSAAIISEMRPIGSAQRAARGCHGMVRVGSSGSSCSFRVVAP